MKIISLWSYVKEEIHNENERQEEAKHECPLAELLEKTNIEDKKRYETDLFPKVKIRPYPFLED